MHVKLRYLVVYIEQRVLPKVCNTYSQEARQKKQDKSSGEIVPDKGYIVWYEFMLFDN